MECVMFTTITKNIILFSLLSLFIKPVLAEPIADKTEGEITRALFTSAVQNREPIDQLNVLSELISEAFFFTEFRGFQGHTLTHQWSHNNKVSHSIPFVIKGKRWRVFSSKTFTAGAKQEGTWVVKVLDEEGTVLSETSIDYIRPSTDAELAAGLAAAEADEEKRMEKAESSTSGSTPSNTDNDKATANTGQTESNDQSDKETTSDVEKDATTEDTQQDEANDTSNETTTSKTEKADEANDTNKEVAAPKTEKGSDASDTSKEVATPKTEKDDATSKVTSSKTDAVDETKEQTTEDNKVAHTDPAQNDGQASTETKDKVETNNDTKNSQAEADSPPSSTDKPIWDTIK